MRSERAWPWILIVAIVGLALAWGGCGVSEPQAPSQPSPESVPKDDDGVQMLLPSAPGSSFRLGTQDPNRADRFTIERGTTARRRNDGAIAYWNVTAHDLAYASGGTGKTTRLHVYASGGQQRHSWRNQPGYLSSPSDLRNQEFTAFVRVHDIFDVPRGAVTLKIRGGAHTSTNGDLASCTMMTFEAEARGVTRFGKELIHPEYDYVTLTPRFTALLTDGRWIGMKLVSHSVPSDPSRVVNRLYLDTDPFDAAGRPANRWQLLSEYVDVEGKSTGRYSKLADWGGWQTTVRTDGVSELDFALVSVREILPPA